MELLFKNQRLGFIVKYWKKEEAGVTIIMSNTRVLSVAVTRLCLAYLFIAGFVKTHQDLSSGIFGKNLREFCGYY